MTNTINLTLKPSYFYRLESTEIDPKDFLLENAESITDMVRWNIKLYALGNEFGALCVCFASNEQDAFDMACDAGKLECMQVEEEDLEQMSEAERDYLTPLGNASELHNLDYAWIQEVDGFAMPNVLWFEIGRKLGEGLDTLDD